MFLETENTPYGGTLACYGPILSPISLLEVQLNNYVNLLILPEMPYMGPIITYKRMNDSHDTSVSTATKLWAGQLGF